MQPHQKQRTPQGIPSKRSCTPSRPRCNPIPQLYLDESSYFTQNDRIEWKPSRLSPHIKQPTRIVDRFAVQASLHAVSEPDEIIGGWNHKALFSQELF